MTGLAFPLAVLAELTHRCPLQCQYCYNPQTLERAGREMDTAAWLRTIEEVAGLGALQIHFSGGEPALRKDLETLVEKDIWESSEAFEAYRGTAWMGEPCRSCERREIDWGGCRCQAFALTGRAGNADPACALSSEHAMILAIAEGESSAAGPDLVYRNYANAPKTLASAPWPRPVHCDA